MRIFKKPYEFQPKEIIILIESKEDLILLDTTLFKVLMGETLNNTERTTLQDLRNTFHK